MTGQLFIYSLLSGITLACLYIAYRPTLSNTTLFRFNRLCIITMYAIATVAPFITFSLGTNTAAVGEVTFTPEIISAKTVPTVADNGAFQSVIKYLLVIYLTGVVVVALRLAADLVYLSVLKIRSTKAVIAGTEVRLHKNEKAAPFSWGGDIFLPRSMAAEKISDLKMIIEHEKAHLEKRHWVDLLISNIVTVVQWYNPAAWLMHGELIKVHEFEADRCAVETAEDPIEYQLLLIKKTAGNRFHAIADSLNHSSLKNRITMMMKNQTKDRARLRALAIVPAVAVALCLTNSSCVNDAKDQITATEDAVENQAAGLTDSATPEQSESIQIQHTNGKHQVRGALVIIDGVEGDIRDVDPDNIESVSVLTDDDARSLYGDRAASGVIIVTTKPSANEKKNSQLAKPASEASYPGGMQAFYNDLAKVIKWNDNLKEGRVVIEFTINTNGDMTNCKVVKGVSPETDKYAVECVKSIKTKWTPAKNDEGKAIDMTFVIPVSFKTE